MKDISFFLYSLISIIFAILVFSHFFADFNFMIGLVVLVLIGMPMGSALSDKKYVKTLPISLLGVLLAVWVSANEPKDAEQFVKLAKKDIQSLSK